MRKPFEASFLSVCFELLPFPLLLKRGPSLSYSPKGAYLQPGCLRTVFCLRLIAHPPFSCCASSPSYESLFPPPFSQTSFSQHTWYIRRGHSTNVVSIIAKTRKQTRERKPIRAFQHGRELGVLVTSREVQGWCCSVDRRELEGEGGGGGDGEIRK